MLQFITDHIGAIAIILAVLVVFYLAVVFFSACELNKQDEKEQDTEGEDNGRVIIMQYPEIGITDYIN